MPSTPFLELARRRQSDRGFLNRSVPRELVERCLEAARLAPSACNSQPWYFIAIDDPAIREPVAQHLHDLLMNRFVTTAPVLVVVALQTPPLIPRLAGAWKDKPYHLMDIGAAVQNFCLAASEQGLGTCILGWFDETRLKEVLNIPQPVRVPLAICVGYPADTKNREKRRKTPKDVWSWNGYSA